MSIKYITTVLPLNFRYYFFSTSRIFFYKYFRHYFFLYKFFFYIFITIFLHLHFRHHRLLLFLDFQSFCSRGFLVVLLDSCFFSLTHFWYRYRIVFVQTIPMSSTERQVVIKGQYCVFHAILYHMCKTLKCVRYCELPQQKSFQSLQ